MRQAAAYVRMSTEHQKYSIENQLASIIQYCEKNELEICRVYSDAGISGLTFESRPGLRSLVNDAETGALPFEVVVVLDVSRWGRFQNVDEGAYYEHLLLRAGVRMIYCAEPFENDDTPVTTIIKSLKRAMAAEFSRELSRKVSAGKRRVASKGFRSGGCAGYGYRRVILGRDGRILRVAGKGDWASESGRTTLQLGPPEEVAAVRRLYHLYAIEHLRMRDVATELNREGHPPPHPDGWTSRHVGGIVRNEKYCGTVVFGRVRQFLSSKRKPVEPSEWLRVPNAHPAIVSPKMFRLAQLRWSRTRRSWPQADLLKGLKDLFSEYGTVTRALIDASPKLPSSSQIRKSFGAFAVAYEAAGLPFQTENEKRSIMGALRAQWNGRKDDPRPSRRRTPVDWDFFLTKASRKGWTAEQVAAQTGVSPETVQRRGKGLGLVFPRTPRTGKIKWAKELARAQRDQESPRQLAARLGTSVSYVDKARGRLGVHLKPDDAPSDLYYVWPEELKRAQEFGESPAEVARRLGVARQTAAAAARRHGLLLRGQRGARQVAAKSQDFP